MQLGQIVLSLTINAAQAISREGTVTIFTRNVKLTKDDSDKLLYPHPGAYVHLCVQDDGCGMTPEIRERIFDPFFGTKTPGLGLAAVYGIAKNHRGYITVNSTQGKGTKFDIYLPAIIIRDQDDEITVDENLRGNETILVDDDDRSTRLLAKRTLQRLGYSVLEAENGKQGVEYACQNSIDVVLLDMVMPVMNDPEAFPLLRLEQPDAKIILCSGFGLNPATQQLIEQGAHGFLQKPFRRQPLASEIQKLLDVDDNAALNKSLQAGNH